MVTHHLSAEIFDAHLQLSAACGTFFNKEGCLRHYLHVVGVYTDIPHLVIPELGL